MFYKVGLLSPRNQVYIKDFLEEYTIIRGIIPLKEGIILEVLPVTSILVTPIEVLLEALTKYSSL
jgi:hypothetical protein